MLKPFAMAALLATSDLPPLTPKPQLPPSPRVDSGLTGCRLTPEI